MKDRAEEKNNGCVDIKNISVNQVGVGGEGRGVTPPVPSPFCNRLLYLILI